MKCKIDGCSKSSDSHGMCQMHNWRIRHYADPLRERPVKLCSLEGCIRKQKAFGLCALHYDRHKKGISLTYTKPELKKQYYRQITRPKHPLASKNGRVLEHRLVLFEHIGFLSVPCFWCGARLVFGENLFVDHLNHDRHDNSPKNLVPACNSCNAGRTIANPKNRIPVYTVS